MGDLGKALKADAMTLLNLLAQFGEWQAARDAKLNALETLLQREHADRKVLVFTQFADTVRYLENHLTARGMSNMAAVTGDYTRPDNTGMALQPEKQRKSESPGRKRTARTDRYRCAERRTKFAGLRHCR